MTRVLLVVSGEVAPDLDEQVARGDRPRADYTVMAAAMGADLVDVREARRRCGRMGAMVERLAGVPGLMGWYCFRARRRYDAIFTDGEHVGLPFAALCRLVPSRHRPAHVMIAHIMSVPAKVRLFRWLRLGGMVDRIVVYATAQRDFLVDGLGYPRPRVVLSSFMVDTSYFRPDAVPARPGERPLVVSAGLERRDYDTFMAAVRDLDVRVVIAAASPWSKQADRTQGADIPPNVEITRLGLRDLRQLYADSAFVVMPLIDTEFQAGVTTILEAMAMGRAVICSRTRGQTDVLTDGVTGVYVPPADVPALRAALVRLLASPEEATRLGAAARAEVVESADIETYAVALADVVRAAAAERGR